jgi:hypothetical protein
LSALRNKRLPKRVKLFRQGELGWLTLGTLKKAGGEATTAEIVTAILAAGGRGESAWATMAPRVRANLSLSGTAEIKTASARTPRWDIVS